MLSRLFPALALAPSLALAAPQAPVPQQPGGCAATIDDAANPGTCIPASTVPTPGALLPLGPEFFVSPVGEVGIGTMLPGAELDVFGSLRVSGQVAFGSDAVLHDPGWGRLFDFSHTITDFQGLQLWDGLRSRILIDPPIDLTGQDATYIYGKSTLIQVPDANDRDIEFLYGPSSWVTPRGTGTVNVIAGGLTVAETDAGHVNEQTGLWAISRGDHASTVDDNAALQVRSGHNGPGGTVVDNYSIYVWSPYAGGTIENHYGLFLEDQEYGNGASYSIYSAGGTNYFGGEVGIGVADPLVALDVVGDFAATGTKSFVQPHPDDPGKEIWFVCLEGNEAGTYFRGTASLEGGRAVIPVPADFRAVSEEFSLTVQLTPKGDARLWYEEKSLDRIVIGGSADVEFDYFVNGVRRGYADFETVRARGALAQEPPTRPASTRRFVELEPAQD